MVKSSTSNISLKDFDTSKLSLKNNGKNYYIKYDDKDFNIKLKNIYSNFGISDYNNNGKYNITFSTNDDVLTFLQELKLKLTVLLQNDKDRKLLLKCSKKDVQEKLKNFYKESKDVKYKPNMTLRLLNSNEKYFNVKSFDKDKNLLKMTKEELIEHFGTKTTFSVLVKPSFYIIENEKVNFGVSFQIVQLLKKKNYKKIECELSDDEKEIIEKIEKL